MTKEPFPAYYAFKAFNALYCLGEQVELSLDTEGLCAVAAKRGGEGCILIANPTESDLPLSLTFEGAVTKCLITTEGKNEEETLLPSILPANSFLLISAKI